MGISVSPPFQCSWVAGVRMLCLSYPVPTMAWHGIVYAPFTPYYDVPGILLCISVVSPCRSYVATELVPGISPG